MSDIQSVTRSEPVRSSVWRWWKSLDEQDRGGRAELRRCASVVQVAFTPAYHRLLGWLGSRLGEGDARRVAALAAILAHVEREPSEGGSLAKRMGTPRAAGQGPLVADTRFRQLLRTEDLDELLRETVRVVRQLDRTAAVDPLFRDVMRWDEPTRLRWAREYYEALPAQARSPAATSEPKQTTEVK